MVKSYEPYVLACHACYSKLYLEHAAVRHQHEIQHIPSRPDRDLEESHDSDFSHAEAFSGYFWVSGHRFGLHRLARCMTWYEYYRFVWMVLSSILNTDVFAVSPYAIGRAMSLSTLRLTAA